MEPTTTQQWIAGLTDEALHDLQLDVSRERSLREAQTRRNAVFQPSRGRTIDPAEAASPRLHIVETD